MATLQDLTDKEKVLFLGARIDRDRRIQAHFQRKIKQQEQQTPQEITAEFTRNIRPDDFVGAADEDE